MSSYTREVCLCWLASGGLSPEQLRRILDAEPDPKRVYEGFLAEGALPETPELPERLNRQLRANAAERVMDRWTQMVETQGIQAMTIGDKGYPARLRPLAQAPAILFYQGNPEALNGHTVSMVGSRGATLKGLEATRKIAEKLSRGGIRIVSGLAYGVDTAAHQGCLKGGSPTIAILGCGLDQQYPAENSGLRRSIVESGGLILSEYTPGEKPLGWHFPWRNRIISGLGDCLALMEARLRSGSITSVQHALEQGRDVFVYPGGEPESAKCEGNHQLLREGAIYFTTAEDLMDDMGWLDKTEDVGQNNGRSLEAMLEGLPPAERQVVTRLTLGDQSFDQLCEALGMPAAQLNATMSMLQIRGLIQALPGKIYAIRPE